MFRTPPEEITLEDWEMMAACKQVRRQLEIQRSLQAREDHAAASNRTYEVE